VKEGWQTTTLGDVCHVYQPETISQKQLKPGEFRVYGANGQIGWHNAFNHDAPQLILGCRGSCGTVHFTEPRSWINGNAMVVQPTDGLIDIDFLAYALKGGIDLRDAITGTAQPQITRTSLSPIAITFPESLAKQRRIVALLDKTFEALTTAKANVEQNIQNARALFESHLESVFSEGRKGWVEKRLEDVGKTQTGSTPNASDSSNYGDFIPFVKPGDFNADGSLDLAKTGLSESGAKNARIVSAGSALMVCIGATIGKCGYCDQDVTTNQQVNALTPSDGSCHQFIYYQMLTASFQQKVMHASGQATLPIINKSKWSSLPLWLPLNVNDQRRIAKELQMLSKEIQRLASLYERKLAALEELKKSLLHQAFSGEL
jgi:type I restriction enzyme S subunit